MTLRSLRGINQNQRGFTLVELLVVIAITGFIVGPVTAAITQFSDINARSTAHMTAIKEVENGVHWIASDAQMAQTVGGELTAPGGLTLTWSNDWASTTDSVNYAIQSGKLWRSYSPNGGQPSSVVVVQYISSDPLMTYSQQPSAGVLNFKITVNVEGRRPASETRSFTIRLRSVQ
jgi:prepilin-type N-terminal cleavage/methylation domain-containing protein